MLNLRGVAAAKLRAGGVTEIVDVDRCTYAEADEFFSHRRDDGITGRQAGIAWLA
jgi:copper oxidase (laccase) domain-containing protein